MSALTWLTDGRSSVYLNRKRGRNAGAMSRRRAKNKVARASRSRNRP